MVCSVAYVAGVLTIFGSTASVFCVKEQLPTPEQVRTPLPLWNSLTESVFRAWPHSELDQPRSVEEIDVNSTCNKGCKQLENETEVLSGAVHDNTRKMDFRQRGQYTSSFQFPGLLALVMLRDTVLQFVSGLQSKYATRRGSKAKTKPPMDVLGDLKDDLDPENGLKLNDGDSMGRNVVLSGVICSYGCCGHKSGYDKVCYNLTVPFANSEESHARGHWYFEDLDGPKLKLGQDHAISQMENTKCFPNFVCQCCCGVTPTKVWTRPSRDLLDLLKVTLPLHRIEEPVAGMTFGYGTSPSSAVAAAV